MIVEYIKKVIEENFIKSKEQNVIGKFILRNYSQELYEKLIDSFSNKEILFISDKTLKVKNSNFLKVSKEELAQFRNENVKNFDLSNISYIIFITDNVIDTLNDLATLSVDDVKAVFLDLLDEELKEFFKFFLKEFEEADIFEIEKFLNEIKEKYEEGYPLNEAIGDSLLYSFKCRKCVNLEKLKDFFKEYRKISNYFYKRAKRDIEKEELLEAFEENKEEFESLEEEKLTLMKKFIEADVSDENYDRFRKLDYKEDLVYKLFEKVSAPAKKLGEEIIEFLEKKEVLKKEHKEFLEEFDSLPPKNKELKREELKEIYDEYKPFFEENRKLLKKIEKFIFRKEIEENNFFVALIKLIKEYEADRIEISLDKTNKNSINDSYSKYALSYIKHRILPLKFDKVNFNINLDFEFKNEKTSSRYNNVVFIAKIIKDDVEEKKDLFLNIQ